MLTEAQSSVGMGKKTCRKRVTWGIKEEEEKY
jgi:hypothetical protein